MRLFQPIKYLWIRYHEQRQFQPMDLSVGGEHASVISNGFSRLKPRSGWINVAHDREQPKIIIHLEKKRIKETKTKNYIMRKTRLSLLFTTAATLLLLVNNGCKKTDENGVPQTNCTQSTFKVKISEDKLDIVDIKEDYLGNILLYVKSQESDEVIKLDSKGSIIWSKKLSGSLYPREMIITSDNSIVLLSEGRPVTENCDVLLDSGLVQVGLTIDCEPGYLEGSVRCSSYNNEVKIIKLDPDGNMVWSRVLPDFYPGGKSMVSKPDGEIVLITIHLYGPQPEYVYDSDGNLTDTVNYPFYNNHITMYSIVKDGTINWTIHFANIYQPLHDPKGRSICIARVGENMLLNTSDDLISVDKKGNEIDRFKPFPELCKNYFFDLQDITKDKYLLQGPCSVGGANTFSNCLEIRNERKEVIWHKHHFYSKIMDALKGNFLVYENQQYKKYDINGDFLWAYDVWNITKAILSCSGGVILVDYFMFDKNKGESGTFIIKTDENGNI